jgi:hypothetical protein
LLSIEGWLNGITASIIFFFGCTFGIYILIKSRRIKAKLLSYIGIAIFFSGFAYSTYFIDLAFILLSEQNLTNINILNILGALNWIGIGIVVILWVYIGSKLLLPKKYKIISLIYSISAIIAEIIMLIDLNNIFIYNFPIPLGIDIIYSPINPDHIFFVITSGLALFALFFLSIGFLIKASKSEDVFKKKYYLLALGWLLYLGSGVFDPVFQVVLAKFFIRIGIGTGIYIIYLGLREEPIKKVINEPKRILKVEGDLFRVYELTPGNITEEEVTLFRDKAICLICRSKIQGFSFLCDCRALYCEKCARALIESENACWVCSTAIDSSKPVKCFTKEKEDIVLKKSNDSL